MIESLLTGAWRRITTEIARSPLMVILIASMWFISLYVFPTVTKNVVDTLAIERTFFENDSFQYFITSADFDRDGDSVTVGTVVFPNIHVPELELRFVQKAQWNPQSFKIVTNTLVLPKPLPLVQIKPSITVGLDMRLKPNVVAGVGVVINL